MPQEKKTEELRDLSQRLSWKLILIYLLLILLFIFLVLLV
jgi:hypothetical protein